MIAYSCTSDTTIRLNPCKGCSTGTTIWVDPYQTAVTGSNLNGPCPNCGKVHRPFPQEEVYVQPSRPLRKPFLTPEQIHRFRNLSWKLSKEAIVEARGYLKSARDDVRTHVPLQDRHRPYVRPPFKKRVCGGSSRYRVMVT